MANNTQVGVVLGADAGPIQRELNRVARDFAKIEKATGGQGRAAQDAFDAKPLRKFARGLRAVRREAVKTHRELAKIAQTVERMTGERISVEGGGGNRSGTRGGGGSGKKRSPARKGAYAAMAAGGGALGWAWSQAAAGLQTLTEQQLARTTTRQLAGREPTRSARTAVQGYGHSLGYRTVETQQVVQGTLRALGVVGGEGIMSNLAMARGYSLDPGMLLAYQQTARVAGDEQTAHQINQALIRGLQRGGFQRAFLGEFAGATSQLLASVQGSQERVTSALISRMVGGLGARLGGVYGKSPGRTAKLLGGVHGTITGPGGGEAGQSFMLRAMGFGRGASYIQALERMEKGITDPANLQRMITQVQQEYQGEDMQALALSRLSGGKLKIHESRRLLRSRGVMGDKSGGRKPSIFGEAGKAGRGLGLTRMNIAKENQRAAVAGAAMPAINAAFQLQMTGMRASIEGFKLASDTAKQLSQDFQELRKEVNRSGGALNAYGHALRGYYMYLKEGAQYLLRGKKTGRTSR